MRASELVIVAVLGTACSSRSDKPSHDKSAPAPTGVAEVRAWPPTVDLGDGGRFLVDRAVIAGCAESAAPR
jgi:hypothetical protein